MQAKFYSTILEDYYGEASLVRTIWKRLKDMFPERTLENAGVDISLALSLLSSSFRKHEAMRVIKTWVNSWGTSYRMHEDVLFSCLFGCQDAEDSMIHYVQCPFWLMLLTHLLRDPPPSPMPLVRLGVVDPTDSTLKALACSFAGYHAIKRLACNCHYNSDPLTLVQTRGTHRVFLDAFCAAANDCQLDCIAFSTALSLFQGAQGARLYNPGL